MKWLLLSLLGYLWWRNTQKAKAAPVEGPTDTGTGVAPPYNDIFDPNAVYNAKYDLGNRGLIDSYTLDLFKSVYGQSAKYPATGLYSRTGVWDSLIAQQADFGGNGVVDFSDFAAISNANVIGSIRPEPR